MNYLSFSDLSEVNKVNAVFEGEKGSIWGDLPMAQYERFGLKCCMVEQKCKSNPAGRSPQSEFRKSFHGPCGGQTTISSIGPFWRLLFLAHFRPKDPVWYLMRMMSIEILGES